MLIEAETIPYDRARLRGERLLILAPHPDDEVIGCGGLVAQHVDEGRAVRVVIATDGTEAEPSAEREGYRERRQQESLRGLASLGTSDVHFLRFPDRGLGDDAAPKIREHLAAFKPDLICVPSPVEIHPDHLALSRVFCDLVQRDASLFADLAIAHVAFYEVSHPLRPNALVDITDVATRKYQAIAAHESQIAIRDYASYARGLNAYRALTLPSDTKYAEAYFVTPLPELRTTSFAALRERIGAPARIEVTAEALPITVIVRTKDRPALLREAVESIRQNEYPADVVVVNDGGVRPDLANVTLMNHERPAGRSEAMNAGVRAAKTKYISFLDDDDLFYREHLPTLAAAAQNAPSAAAWYSDSVSTFLGMAETGAYETRNRFREFSQDFDRELLLVDNYIPLPTLLVERDGFLDAGGFDRDFDLFEDWDFLIRLSQRGDFVHVPRITCEVRHFENVDSILRASPEGSKRFRDAKLQVWTKHAALIDNDTWANVFEKQKRRALALESLVVEEKGGRSRAENEIERLEREKQSLIAEMQMLHNAVNERTMYIKELEGAIQVLRNEADAVMSQNTLLLKSVDDAQSVGRAAYAEIERLQGLLNMIYRSRTWKLHAMMERMRGRG